jgi:hypothetical protein
MATKKYVYEVLEEARKAKTKEQKVKILKDNESFALKDILRGSYDPKVKFNLPGGIPPYKASDPYNHPSSWLRQNQQLKYFVKGGVGDRMPAFKREAVFIGLLESIHPQDAKHVVDMINKTAPKGVTKAVVTMAFPELL